VVPLKREPGGAASEPGIVVRSGQAARDDNLSNDDSLSNRRVQSPPGMPGEALHRRRAAPLDVPCPSNCPMTVAGPRSFAGGP
jgi:hypothetical protein